MKDQAAFAVRAAGLADIPAMQNQPMMRMPLERSGNDFLKPAFDLKRRLAGR
jgi:hypothetical protein